MADTAMQAPHEQQQPAREQREQDHGPKQKVMSMAYIRRRPDLTSDQFYEHWEHRHGVIVKPWAEKHGMVYTQIHMRRQYKDDAQAIGPEKRPASDDSSSSGGGTTTTTTGTPGPLDDYDGCALFEVDSFEQFSAAFEDEYYKTIIEPDEGRFIDKQLGVMRVRGEVRKITI